MLLFTYEESIDTLLAFIHGASQPDLGEEFMRMVKINARLYHKTEREVLQSVCKEPEGLMKEADNIVAAQTDEAWNSVSVLKAIDPLTKEITEEEHVAQIERKLIQDTNDDPERAAVFKRMHYEMEFRRLYGE